MPNNQSSSRKFFSIEIIIGIMATIVSCCALYMSYEQTKIFRSQQHASVWPRVEWSWSSDYDEAHPERGRFELNVENAGIGPALIQSVQFIYKGKDYEEWQRYDVFRMLLKGQDIKRFSAKSWRKRHGF
jgi:hypothetical protein